MRPALALITWLLMASAAIAQQVVVYDLSGAPPRDVLVYVEGRPTLAKTIPVQLPSPSPSPSPQPQPQPQPAPAPQPPAPAPAPTPAPVPPPVDPAPQPADLATHATLEASRVASPRRAQEAAALAQAYRDVAKAVADNQIGSTNEAMSGLRDVHRAVLGGSFQAWQPALRAIWEPIYGGLSEREKLLKALEDIARGLGAVR